MAVLKKYPKFPTEIITTYYPTNGTDSASRLIINFAQNLSKLWGGAPIKPSNVGSTLAAIPPAAANTSNINEPLDLVYPILTTNEQIHWVRDVSHSF